MSNTNLKQQQTHHQKSKNIILKINLHEFLLKFLVFNAVLNIVSRRLFNIPVGALIHNIRCLYFHILGIGRN
jgi:hypothetical protein